MRAPSVVSYRIQFLPAQSGASKSSPIRRFDSAEWHQLNVGASGNPALERSLHAAFGAPPVGADLDAGLVLGGPAKRAIKAALPGLGSGLNRSNGQVPLSKGISNEFSDWFREADLPANCAAHGVRRAGATIAAENGANKATLTAIFGWEDAKQAVLYTRAARRKKMADAGMHLLVPQKDAPSKSLHAVSELRKEAKNPMKSSVWQERRDSNSQPPVLETGALAN
jgi:hypothetical protein